MPVRIFISVDFPAPFSPQAEHLSCLEIEVDVLQCLDPGGLADVLQLKQLRHLHSPVSSSAEVREGVRLGER